MKLLLDANLSPEVARLLKEAGHEAIHVGDIGLLSAPDPEIMQAAAKEGCVLLTADADFGALLALSSLASPSVLLLRSADHLRPAEQAELLAANLPRISEDLKKGAIVSLTRDRLRVRERHDSRFTRAFEQQVAWLAVNTSGSAVAELMRIAWRSVGRICERVAEEAGRGADLLAGLERIGIDEISHRKGHRYLTVVVDHDTGRLIWAAPGRDKATVEAFFDALGAKRTKQLKLVSCDMAGWIEAVLAERCPKAKRCVDPFHVIQLATEALDKVRREVWNEARRAGQGDAARQLKGARFCLWKNPENLTARQQSKLADVERLNRPLYRAYLLKEQLRQIYRLPARKAIALLDEWISWARRCRLRPFVKLARTIAAQRQGIVAAIRHGLSNARVEAINTQIRLIARRAFGFHSPQALIALAMLKLGGLCPPLPGRVTVT